MFLLFSFFLLVFLEISVCVMFLIYELYHQGFFFKPPEFDHWSELSETVKMESVIWVQILE